LYNTIDQAIPKDFVIKIYSPSYEFQDYAVSLEFILPHIQLYVAQLLQPI